MRGDDGGLRALLADERGVAASLDFLLSMVIRVAVFTVFIALSVTFAMGLSAQSPADYYAAQAGADRLAEDLLVDDVGDDELSRSCTEAFFAKQTGTCGFKSSWASSRDYLDAALSIHQRKSVNVSVRRLDNGDIVRVNGQRLAMGPHLDGADDDTLYTFKRQAPLDRDGDDDLEWVTIYSNVWG
jgi:hypothetical protein